MYAALGDDFQEQLLARATGSTALGVKASKLPELRIDLPSLEEQRSIITHLDEQAAKIDTLIAETQRFIELSKERRSALITAAVTGQIDVREMA
jgi:type I restriction enzyme, S subunit